MSEFTHSGEKKKQYVKQMFEDISHRYDLFNHLSSFGIDIYWRKKLVNTLDVSDGGLVLDVATGTGDVAFAVRKKYDVHVIGLDYAFNMVRIAKEKSKKHGEEYFKFVQGDGEYLPFKDNTFDALTISYGFRNIGHYKEALSEFYRVLKPGGKLAIMEFSEPTSKLFGALFRFYFNKVIPKIGALLAREDAFRYLPESVDHFPSRKKVNQMIVDAGFMNSEVYDLTFGVSSIFMGNK
jgi:demethylmenaquinone methyltransferase/2-methoxy-6-polyprenyl-1,4-benzoquinol methylase